MEEADKDGDCDKGVKIGNQGDAYLGGDSKIKEEKEILENTTVAGGWGPRAIGNVSICRLHET